MNAADDNSKHPLSEEERRALHRTAWRVGYRIRRSYARQLRKNLTPAEKRLWKELQKQQTGGKGWRRQHIIDRYIVDFVHLGAKLVIEVDGAYHMEKEQLLLDQERDEALTEAGWTVLRYRNRDVFADAEAIGLSLLEMIGGGN